MKFAVRLISSIFAAAALVGCGSRSEDRFSKVAIPDENRVDVEFRRLDRELTGLNYASSASEFAKLKDAYAAEDSSDMNFLDIYTEAVLNIGNVDQMECSRGPRDTSIRSARGPDALRRGRGTHYAS